MFSTRIFDLALTSPVADTMFPNIKGLYFRNDESFVATLRAIMRDRVPQDESISLDVRVSDYSNNDLLINEPEELIKSFLRDTDIYYGRKGCLYVHSFNSSDDVNKACFDILDEYAVRDVLDSYVELKDVAKWFEQVGKTQMRVYLSEKHKNVLIFVQRLNLKRWHLIQSLLPRYFPWYFKDKPRTEEETQILASLTKTTPDEYESLMREVAKKIDFRTYRIRSLLADFETSFERDTLRNVQSNMSDVRRNIRRLEDQFSTCYRQLEELETQELGLLAKINQASADDDSEFMEFFICNKAIDIVAVRNSSIEFIVKTTLSNYDPDVFDSAINNPNSFFYRSYYNGCPYKNYEELTDERIKRLMTAIFQDEKLKLKICAAYKLDFGNGKYEAKDGYAYPAEVLKFYTPNQHIDHYACLGNNAPVIREAMVRRDYIAAINACCASAANVNFTEANTGTFMMENIHRADVGKIIQMPDGSSMTPLEAAVWLEEHEDEI